MSTIQSQFNESFGLIKLLANYLYSIPASVLHPRRKLVFPKNINQYYFVRNLTNHENENVGVALYKTKSGVKVIVKRWEGQFKDYNYYSIVNEASTYSVLNQTLQKVSDKMPKKYKNILIPKLLYTKKEKTSFTMIIEWINGKTISTESNKRKVDEYLRVREFLQFLGDQVSANDKKVIATRKSIDYLMLFPVVLVIALILSIDDFPTYLSAAILFFSYAPALLSNKHMSLVHRDLHFDNIMISGKKIYVIDLQFCVFTYSACEVATTLRYLSNDRKMSSYFLKNINRRDPWSKEDAKLLKPMIIMLGVHGLTGRNFTAEILNDFKLFLKQGLAMQSNQLPIL